MNIVLFRSGHISLFNPVMILFYMVNLQSSRLEYFWKITSLMYLIVSIFLFSKIRTQVGQKLWSFCFWNHRHIYISISIKQHGYIFWLITWVYLLFQGKIHCPLIFRSPLIMKNLWRLCILTWSHSVYTHCPRYA